MVQPYFHFTTCCIVNTNNNKSIPDKPVTSVSPFFLKTLTANATLGGAAEAYKFVQGHIDKFILIMWLKSYFFFKVK